MRVAAVHVTRGRGHFLRIGIGVSVMKAQRGKEYLHGKGELTIAVPNLAASILSGETLFQEGAHGCKMLIAGEDFALRGSTNYSRIERC